MSETATPQTSPIDPPRRLPAVLPFEEIVARHGATVLRVCRAVVGPVDAEDAWSETFLAALRAYPGLPEDTNWEAWLVTVAHRKAIDLHRAARRRAVPVEPVPEPAGGADGADEEVARHGDLYDALRRLPDKQRQAVAYHHLAGLPHREVAAVLGGTEAAARRASADGIRALRVRYHDVGLEETVDGRP
ncbi:RNA polymerase sigma factor [Blastococcus sp. SYSU DS0753]